VTVSSVYRGNAIRLTPTSLVLTKRKLTPKLNAVFRSTVLGWGEKYRGPTRNSEVPPRAKKVGVGCTSVEVGGGVEVGGRGVEVGGGRGVGVDVGSGVGLGKTLSCWLDAAFETLPVRGVAVGF
jgi:hypothetical protein